MIKIEFFISKRGHVLINLPSFITNEMGSLLTFLEVFLSTNQRLKKTNYLFEISDLIIFLSLYLQKLPDSRKLKVHNSILRRAEHTQCFIIYFIYNNSHTRFDKRDA